MWGWTVKREEQHGHLDRKPHVCGDGPFTVDQGEDDPDVNPTYVGMDRLVFMLSVIVSP